MTVPRIADTRIDSQSALESALVIGSLTRLPPASDASSRAPTKTPKAGRNPITAALSATAPRSLVVGFFTVLLHSAHRVTVSSSDVEHVQADGRSWQRLLMDGRLGECMS